MHRSLYRRWCRRNAPSEMYKPRSGLPYAASTSCSQPGGMGLSFLTLTTGIITAFSLDITNLERDFQLGRNRVKITTLRAHLVNQILAVQTLEKEGGSWRSLVWPHARGQKMLHSKAYSIFFYPFKCSSMLSWPYMDRHFPGSAGIVQKTISSCAENGGCQEEHEPEYRH